MKFRLPLVSVIVVNFNGKKFLKSLIPTIQKQTYSNVEIIIVDNGSQDDSIEFLQKFLPDVQVVKSKVNSFSFGNNLGLQNARGEFIFFLNNDTELDLNCIAELIKSAQQGDVRYGMWSCKILNYFDRQVIDNTGLSIYPDGMSRGRGRGELDNGQFDQEAESCFPSGCAALYRRSLLDVIGGFDEDFHFFVEDSDLGFRARLYGSSCKFVSTAIVYHMYSSTVGKFSSKKAFLVERNRIWLMIKNYPPRFLFMSPWYTLKRYVYQFYGIIKGVGASGKYVQQNSFFKLFFVTIFAWISAIVKIPKMFLKRRGIYKSKKLSNLEIYTLFTRFSISVKDLSLKE